MPSGWKTADGRNLKEAYWNTVRFEKDGVQYKVCRTCKKAFPLTEYTRKTSVKDGRAAHCKTCLPALKKASLYNTSIDVISSLSDCCAICGTTKKLGIDHNHQTGQVREKLCSSCNTGIGLLQEDIRLLTKAIEYLKSHTD